jgi:hypothetical protein
MILFDIGHKLLIEVHKQGEEKCQNYARDQLVYELPEDDPKVYLNIYRVTFTSTTWFPGAKMF